MLLQKYFLGRKNELFHNEKITACCKVTEPPEHVLSRAALKYVHILMRTTALHNKRGAGHLEPN